MVIAFRGVHAQSLEGQREESNLDWEVLESK